jgi:hypothetical protein
MLATAISALMAAYLSMLLIFENKQYAGKTVFGVSLVLMVISMIMSLYETSLSNRSLNIEINDMLRKEARVKQQKSH